MDRNMKHLFSESATWETTSEFVNPQGEISYAQGQSTITVKENEITNSSWAQLGEVKRVNNYRITPVSASKMVSESLNPELGKQTGIFHIDRNRVFSKFTIEGTTLNGFEIIRREYDTCYAEGALYDKDELINTWTATMIKINHVHMKPDTNHPVTRVNIVIDCDNAGTLAAFYSKLLGWEWTHPHANGWAAITSPGGMVIAFQEVEDYQPPVWPWKSGKQAQMLHPDFYVDNLEDAVKYAIELGAKPAEEQYFKTSRTMFDPAGHPFCLDTDEPEE